MGRSTHKKKSLLELKSLRKVVSESTGIDITLISSIPDTSDMDMMADTHSTIPLSWDDLPVTNPPDNFSSLELADIKAVLDRVKHPLTSLCMMEAYDKDYLSLFKKFLESKGRSYNENYFRNVSKDLEPIILQLKYFYNRPRPSQIAPLYGIKLDALTLDTVDSPSYPSGHTMQAYVIGILLAKQFPDLSSDLIAISELISQSRVDAGVHFLSDVVFGRILSVYIAKGILDENFA